MTSDDILETFGGRFAGEDKFDEAETDLPENERGEDDSATGDQDEGDGADESRQDEQPSPNDERQKQLDELKALVQDGLKYREEQQKKERGEQETDEGETKDTALAPGAISIELTPELDPTEDINFVAEKIKAMRENPEDFVEKEEYAATIESMFNAFNKSIAFMADGMKKLIDNHNTSIQRAQEQQREERRKSFQQQFADLKKSNNLSDDFEPEDLSVRVLNEFKANGGDLKKAWEKINSKSAKAQDKARKGIEKKNKVAENLRGIPSRQSPTREKQKSLLSQTSGEELLKLATGGRNGFQKLFRLADDMRLTENDDE